MLHVFIIGSKGIPARYGGFETFAEQLTARKRSPGIMYHISCMDNEETDFEHNGAHCFNVRVPFSGPPGRIAHVGLALTKVEKWLKDHPAERSIVYILGCRIGPLLIPHARKLHQLGARIFCNPDGLEWKRDKWSRPAKQFLKFCEACLVTNSDLAVCDSVNIEEYIRSTYGDKVKDTTYIAYGADVARSQCPKDKAAAWYAQHDIKPGGFYLIVGRFVPENNYETMIREFMASSTKKDLVIITNHEKNRFYEMLAETTRFPQDARIKFVGTVYDQELLKRIREDAYAYLHGHEVGGTNPSLLEALSSTRLNLLLDVGFNREVAKDSSLYWTKEPGSLKRGIEVCDQLEPQVIDELDEKSTGEIRTRFSWDSIVEQYESLFLTKGLQ